MDIPLSLVYACLTVPQSNETCVLRYTERVSMRRLTPRFTFCLASPRRSGQCNTTLSSASGTNGFADIENIISCVFLGIFLARLPFNLLYEGKIRRLFPFNRRLCGFKLQTRVTPRT